MKRAVLLAITIVTLFASGARIAGQAANADKVLADTRAALGGEKKLAGLATFAATGQSTRVMNEQSQPPGDFEMAFELPDRFMKKEVVAQMPGGFAVTHTGGFNGDTAINITDQPPMGGGVRMVIKLGPDEGKPGEQTPEQQEAARKRLMIANKQEFARTVLGILPMSLATYPLQFTYGGQAESPDGKAHVVEVTGEGDFAARLFIDAKSHMPLMLSWMAKEPIRITNTIARPGGATAAGKPGEPAGAGGAAGKAPGNLASMSPEEREKFMQEAAARAKEAEAKARVVEYRVYYSDYRNVDGVQVPFKLQRSIDGKLTEEIDLEKVKINGKIDPKKFETK